MPVWSKEFLDIQATIMEFGVTLKRIRDITRTYSQSTLCNCLLSIYNFNDNVIGWLSLKQ